MCNAEERTPCWLCVQGSWAGWLTAQGSSVCVTPSCSCGVPGWPGEHLLFLTPLTAARGRGGRRWGAGGWHSRTDPTPAQRSCLGSSSKSEAFIFKPPQKTGKLLGSPYRFIACPPDSCRIFLLFTGTVAHEPHCNQRFSLS